VDERDLAGETLGMQGAQHRHHRRDAATAGHEQNAPRPHCWEYKIAAGRVEADDHAGPCVLVEVVGDQAAVVSTDRQLDVRGILGARR
jgi:hypothetical protein